MPLFAQVQTVSRVAIVPTALTLDVGGTTTRKATVYDTSLTKVASVEIGKQVGGVSLWL